MDHVAIEHFLLLGPDVEETLELDVLLPRASRANKTPPVKFQTLDCTKESPAVRR